MDDKQKSMPFFFSVTDKIYFNVFATDRLLRSAGLTGEANPMN